MRELIWRFENWTTGEILEAKDVNTLKQAVSEEWDKDNIVKVYKYGNPLPMFIGSTLAVLKKEEIK